MANKNIKKEVKKKKADAKPTSLTPKPVYAEPVLVKKSKKEV